VASKMVEELDVSTLFYPAIFIRKSLRRDYPNRSIDLHVREIKIKPFPEFNEKISFDSDS